MIAERPAPDGEQNIDEIIEKLRGEDPVRLSELEAMALPALKSGFEELAKASKEAFLGIKAIFDELQGNINRLSASDDPHREEKIKDYQQYLPLIEKRVKEREKDYLQDQIILRLIEKKETSA